MAGAGELPETGARANRDGATGGGGDGESGGRPSGGRAAARGELHVEGALDGPVVAAQPEDLGDAKVVLGLHLHGRGEEALAPSLGAVGLSDDRREGVTGGQKGLEARKGKVGCSHKDKLHEA